MASPTTTVKSAVEKARSVYNEWLSVGDPKLREPQTRYALIDPILRALGWDTADPKECYPEWTFRKHQSKRVDYVLFARSTAQEIIDGSAIPVIIIEAKSVYSTDHQPNRENGQAIWEKDIQQLQKYLDREPGMSEGLAVFTNGRRWLLFLLGDGRRLNEIPPVEVDLERDSAEYFAGTLCGYMGREQW